MSDIVRVGLRPAVLPTPIKETTVFASPYVALVSRLYAGQKNTWEVLQSRYQWADGSRPAGIYNSDGSVVVVYVYRERQDGTWDARLLVAEEFRYGTGRMTAALPGGAVDAGHTGIQAAILETLEETGYDARDPRLAVSLARLSEEEPGLSRVGPRVERTTAGAPVRIDGGIETWIVDIKIPHGVAYEPRQRLGSAEMIRIVEVPATVAGLRSALQQWRAADFVISTRLVDLLGAWGGGLCPLDPAANAPRALETFAIDDADKDMEH
ncbi:hypothetical protein Q5752_001252 [Cryptotrichosporon argae]